ncbi:MAG: DUF4278 domain-containing protein, partial [Thermosynechococcaceae cyanobacterium]
MKLQYRGVSYDYTPPTVEMEPSETVGQYRGLEWRFRNPKKALVLQPNLDLMYRGVCYQTGEPTVNRTTDFVPVAQATSTRKPSTAVQNRSRALMMSHHAVIQRREQSMLGRAAAEVGLGEDAMHYWHPLQGKI